MKKTKGFTLVEIMVVVVILGIIAIFAMPSIGTAIANNKIRAAAESVQSGLRKAQQMAATRNGDVTFVFTTGAFTKTSGKKSGTCPPDGLRVNSSNKNQATHWVICTDANNVHSSNVDDPNDFDSDPLPITQMFRSPDEDVIDIETFTFTKEGITFLATGGTSAFTFENNRLVEPKIQFTSAAREPKKPNINNCAGNDSETNPDKSNPGSVRCLQVLVKLGGKSRVCDPGYDGISSTSQQMKSMMCKAS